jgi:hypothetical protein
MEIIASNTEKPGLRTLLGGTTGKLFTGTVRGKRFRFYKDIQIRRFPPILTGHVIETEYGCMIQARFNYYRALSVAFLTGAIIGFLLSVGLLAEACLKGSIGPQIFFAILFTSCMVIWGRIFFRSGLRFQRYEQRLFEDRLLRLFDGVERYEEENSKCEARIPKQ